MKEENNDIDYIQIGKYLDGDLSVPEREKVENWINRTDENRHEFNRIRKLWDQAESMTPASKALVNVDEAWEKLSARIRNENSIPEPVTDILKKEERTRNITRYLLRIAAVIVLVLGIYTIFNQLSRQPETINLVAENEIQEALLPDESAITLNENSTLTYPQKFTGEQRIVELKGEAFFEVKRNVKKPFIVEVQDAMIEVLGTSFNVRALENETEVTVTVQEGKVMLADKEDIAYVLLEPHEKGILNRKTGHIEKYFSPDESEMFWKTRTLIFRDTQLSSVFKTLEKVYEVKIIILDEALKTCLLTAKFQDQNIDEILTNIAINFGLTVQKKESSFIISGEGC